MFLLVPSPRSEPKPEAAADQRASLQQRYADQTVATLQKQIAAFRESAGLFLTWRSLDRFGSLFIHVVDEAKRP